MRSKPLALEQRLFAAFIALLVILAGLSLWQWRAESPVSANLLQILPHADNNQLIEYAQQRTQAVLDQELIVLIQHPQASQRLSGWAKQLQDSGQFSHVEYQLSTNLKQLSQQLLAGRASFVPLAVREQLAQQPQQFFSERINEIFDPLGGFSLVSVQQDWLGLTGKIQHSLQSVSRVQSDAQGFLFVDSPTGDWYLLRLRSQQSGFADASVLKVAEQIQQLAQQIKQQGGQVLASGGLLFSAQAQQQAGFEIQWLGGISLLGSLLLIVWLFRRFNSLVALLPALFGLWVGVTACIAVFGYIHALTLVLGISLIGVTIDFPMHYLSKGWVMQPWHSAKVLRATLPGLTLGVLSNAIGYVALAFTPFPALSQVAVFSVAGLLAAYVCTICCLPWLLAKPDAVQPWRLPLAWMQRLLTWHKAIFTRLNGYALAFVLLIFVVVGFAQLQLHNDLRQWVVPAPELLEQAQRIGQLTGQQPTSQFFLLQGADEPQLIERLSSLQQQLDQHVAQGDLSGYQSITDLLAGLLGQPSLAHALAVINEQDLQPFADAGIATGLIEQEIQQLQAQQPLSIEQALASDLGEPWRMLWLGKQDNQYVAMVRLQGLRNSQALAELAQQQEGVIWVDRPAQLNQLFQHTQSYALWSKVLASVAIFIVLMVFLGWRGALRTLSVSLFAALLAAASLGWLGLPVTLFSVFGLLLVTAIGVDYAIIMYEGVGGQAASLLGAFLAAITTWLSFGLLALSSTPAVSSFGIAVSLGLVFSFLLAPWASKGNPSA
ncbi:MMPL family transporter [Thiopseudomonas acetoxidans]|uniref:Membrane transport protein MMPL domain-containing protein n=1 Tax=Thiopseudomonas acetoxidans TaxID=3041622 RepID=A0ABT7SMX5_9GAMM|nr:hypothetical protein [Thiopseudomonas sp. CY1220]MDM7857547.1 hypothetical protein [Thiopseudomonas sp. CY1220]